MGGGLGRCHQRAGRGVSSSGRDARHGEDIGQERGRRGVSGVSSAAAVLVEVSQTRQLAALEGQLG